MADNDDKDHGKAGAEDPKPAAAKPAAPTPAATAKTAPKRRRPGASKAQKDKAPEGESETKPVPADAGAGPDSQSESKPKPLSMKIRTLGVGLVLAIVVGAGAWFTVSAWMDRPARDGLGSQLRSLERMVDDLEGKLGEAEKKLAGEEKKQLAPVLSQTPGPGQTGAGAAPPLNSSRVVSCSSRFRTFPLTASMRTLRIALPARMSIWYASSFSFAAYTRPPGTSF